MSVWPTRKYRSDLRYRPVFLKLYNPVDLTFINAYLCAANKYTMH